MKHKTNFETNKHYKFNLCIIKGNNTVICFNVDKIHYFLDDKEALFNAELWIDERGLLHIESKNFRDVPFNYIMSNYILNIR